MCISPYSSRWLAGICWLALLWPGLIAAQTPFACTGQVFFARLAPGEASSQLFMAPISSVDNAGGWQLITTFTDRKIGPIGFRVVDNLVYALDLASLDLLQIDASGMIFQRGNLKSRLDTTLSYHAGAITPFGKYFILIGRDPLTGYDEKLFRVRLDRPELTTGVTAMLPPTEVQLDDVAFSPVYGTMLGFDALNRKMVSVWHLGGLVTDFNFQTQGQIGRLGGMFFDREGQLYGYGNSGGQQDNSFWKVDVLNGVGTELNLAPLSQTTDACACPYTIPFSKYYTPNPGLDCDEIHLVYRWNSQAGTTFRDIELTDTLPPGVQAVELIHGPNPLSVETPLGGQFVHLKFQDLLLGEDSVVLRIEVDESQATQPERPGYLRDLPLAYGGYVATATPTESNLEVGALAVLIQSDRTQLCEGSLTTLEAIPTVERPDLQYLWSTGDTTAAIDIKLGGTYWVQVQASCEIAADTIEIGTIGAAIQLDLGPDREIIQGERISFPFQTSAVPPYQLSWSNSAEVEMSCFDCPNPESRPLVSTRYRLQLVDANGCEASDSVGVTIQANRAIRIPNVFSPNQDGINDRFFVSGASIATISRFQVFDRLGRLMFQQEGGQINQAAIGWDGEFSGKPIGAGVYYYAIKLTFPDGEGRDYTGSLTLIR